MIQYRKMAEFIELIETILIVINLLLYFLKLLKVVEQKFFAPIQVDFQATSDRTQKSLNDDDCEDPTEKTSALPAIVVTKSPRRVVFSVKPVPVHPVSVVQKEYVHLPPKIIDRPVIQKEDVQVPPQVHEKPKVVVQKE